VAASKPWLRQTGLPAPVSLRRLSDDWQHRQSRPFHCSYDCPRDDPYRDVGTGLRVQRTDADRRQVLIGPRCRVSRQESAWDGSRSTSRSNSLPSCNPRTSFAAPHESAPWPRASVCHRGFKSERFCSVSVIDAAYIGFWRASDLPKNGDIPNSPLPTIGSLVGSGAVSARVRCCAPRTFL
jgi:hypothetical protein